MAKQIRIELSQDEYEQATDVKEQLGVTWKGLIMRATNAAPSEIEQPGKSYYKRPMEDVIDTIQYSKGDRPLPIVFGRHTIRGNTLISSESIDVHGEELHDLFEELSRYVRIQPSTGAFAITQSGKHAWTGFGSKTFIEAVASGQPDNRKQPNDHHHEQVVWVGPGGMSHRNTIITAINRSDTSSVTRLRVHFISDGVPVSPEFQEMLQSLPMQFSTAREWESTAVELRQPTNLTDIKSRVTDYITDYKPDNQTDIIRITNPYKQDASELRTALDSEYDDIVTAISNLDYLFVHIKKTPFYPDEEIKSIELEEFAIQEIDQPQGTASNVYIEASPRLNN